MKNNEEMEQQVAVRRGGGGGAFPGKLVADLDGLALQMIRDFPGRTRGEMGDEWVTRWRQAHPTSGVDEAMIRLRLPDVLDRLQHRGRIRKLVHVAGVARFYAVGKED